jgi:ion channel-forming bestrophin family protein
MNTVECHSHHYVYMYFTSHFTTLSTSHSYSFTTATSHTTVTTTTFSTQNVGREVVAVTSVALLVMLWNMLTAGYTDLLGVDHPALIQSQFFPVLKLPMNPFTLSSSFLGLLLVFRTNKAYQRWDEARKNWGMNINHTRDLVRMGNAFYDSSQSTPSQRAADLDRLSKCTWAFVRAMKRHLSPEWEDEEDFKRELYQRLPESQAQAIINAAHRPNRALYDLSLAIEQLPMHFIRKDEMHKALTIFEDNLGSSERLLTSPVPIFYNRHVARFLFVWHLFVPFALWDACSDSWNHYLMIPSTAILSLFMFGIEELATQMEEPFTILPMQAFCDKIGNWCNEIVSWEDGDNGIITKRAYDGHNSVYFEA